MQTQEQIIQKLLVLIFKLVKERHPNFAKSAINLNDDFVKNLGLDSLSKLELFARIEDSFQTSLPEKLLYEAQTARDLLSAIVDPKDSPNIDDVIEKSVKTLEDKAALPDDAQTLVEVLQWHARKYPNRPHIQFYQDHGDGEVISYGQLNQQALKLAKGLQHLGLQPYQTVAIMLPTCAEYFYSFFGILMAGAIPIPIYPPARTSQLEEHMQRHTRILDNGRVSILITTEEASQVADLLKASVTDMQHIVTIKQLHDNQSNSTVLPQLKNIDTAFIQYTSGSTGDPKGVVLSHANLLANIRAMGKAVNATPKDVFVSWLPLYHDMGLIGAWLGSIYHASLFVVMSPLNFMAKPQRWLWAIHRYGGTLSASPNFGYEYSLQRLKGKDLNGLDLSSWKAAFNGAESVSPITIGNFSEYFKDFGFNPNAITPVYGLAESSVGLTFPPMQRGQLIDTIKRDDFMQHQQAKVADDEEDYILNFVSCGLPLTDHQVRIVDESSHELPERHEGKVQFQGPSSTIGYYKNQSKTQELFDGDWLNSGDRGYIANGELYLTGRSKDIIIRAGRNIYPDELEKVVGGIKGIRRGCVAVFGVTDEKNATERLIVLAETKIRDDRHREQLRQSINTLAADLIGGPPDEVVLAQAGTVLKTSSGKIRRAACRDNFLKTGGNPEKHNIAWQLFIVNLRSLLPRIKRVTKFFTRQLYAYYSWLVFILFTPIAWLFIITLPSVSIRWKAVHFFSKTIAKLIGISVEINALDNLPDDLSNTIMVANHASYIDVLAISAALPLPLRYVAKAELLTQLFSRLPLQKLDTQFVERFDMSKSVDDWKRISEVVNKEAPLFFFPEGTFTRIPGLKPFQLGAFSIAAQSDADIIPIAIQGTRSILRPEEWFPQYGNITIEIGEKLTLSKIEKDMDDWRKTLILSKKSREFILKHCQEPDLVQEAINE